MALRPSGLAGKSEVHDGTLEREVQTLTQAFAASLLPNRTVAMPSGSASKRTVFVTGPSLEHSSRMSSLMSRLAAGSSCCAKSARGVSDGRFASSHGSDEKQVTQALRANAPQALVE